MIRAELPDGTVLEFEEGTPDDVIDRVVKSHVSGKPQQPQQAAPKAISEREQLRLRSPVAGGMLDTLDAAQHWAVGGVQGLAQLGENAINAGANAVLPEGNALRGAINRTTASDNAAMRQREADYQARVPDGIPANIGAVIGAVAPFSYGNTGVQALGQVGKFAETMLSRAPVAGRIVGGAAQGGLGALAAPVTGDGEYWDEKAGQMKSGAIAGGIVPAALAPARYAAEGTVNRLKPAAKALALKAEQMGIPLGIGQLTDNAFVRTIINQMERLPFSGGTARAQARQDAVNKVIARTIFDPKDSATRGMLASTDGAITQDVFQSGKAYLQDGFEQITSRNDLRITPRLLQEMAAIRNAAIREGTEDAGKVVSAQIDRLVKKVSANGTVNGKAYQALYEELGNLAKVGDNPGHYVGRLRDILREGMDRSISPQDQALWKALRYRYAQLKTVEPLVARTATGDIPAIQMTGRATSDKAGKVRTAAGRGGPLADLGQIGQRYLRGAPDSGTADRGLVNMGVAGTTALATGTGTIPLGGAAALAGTLGANRAITAAANSRALSYGAPKVANALAQAEGPAAQAAGFGVAARGQSKPATAIADIAQRHGDRTARLVQEAISNPKDAQSLLLNIPPSRLSDIINKYGAVLKLRLTPQQRAWMLKERQRLSKIRGYDLTEYSMTEQ